MGSKHRINHYDVSILGLSEEKRLVDVLTIGKIGQDINCNHPQVSLRHCTLYFADNILSIKDHASDEGIFINDERIAADQMIIVLEDDQVKLGNLILSLKPDYSTDLIDDLDEGVVGLPPVPDMFKGEVKTEDEDITNEFVPFPLSSPKVADISDEIIEKSITESNKNIVNLANLRGSELETTAPGTQIIFSEEEEIESTLNTSVDITDSDDEVASSYQTQVDIQESSVNMSSDETQSSFDAGEFTQVKINNKVKEKKKDHSDIQFGIIFPVRIFSLFLDIFISILLYSFLPNSFLNLLEKLTSPLAGLFGDSYSGVFSFVLLFGFLKMLANIFFKKSLGQMIAFISVEDQPKARLRSFMRSAFGIILLPISLVLDAPGLIAKSTGKEFIFSSKMYSRSHLVSFLSSLLGLALIAFFTFVLPFQGKKEKEISFEYSTQEIMNTSLDRGKIFSSYFRFQKPFKKKDFLVYPFFKVKRVEGTKTYVPSMQLYSVKEKSFIKVFNLPRGSWSEVLGDSFRNRDPLFKLKFPEINKALNDDRYDEEVFVSEFKTLLKGIFSSNTSWYEHLFSYGPFIVPYKSMQKSISSELEGRVKGISFVKIGKKLFAHFQIEAAKFADEKFYSMLWELSPGKSIRLKFTSQKDLDAVKFYKNYFQGTRWSKASFVGLGSKVDPYQVIDYFSKIKRTNHSVEDLDRIFSYYFTYGKWLTGSEKKKAFREDFVDKSKSLLSLIINLNVVERKKLEKKGSYNPLDETLYDGFIKKMTSLLDSIQKNDKSYFSRRNF